ncbi:hypothetical protein ACFE04_017277 [Oxalis oulophora]
MATLSKFKLKMFSTQCENPRTSPLVHLRRRRTTLRMLMSRKSSSLSPPRVSNKRYSKTTTNQQVIAAPLMKSRSSKLKDLFLSSSIEFDGLECKEVNKSDQIDVVAMKVNPFGRCDSEGSTRPGWLRFRYRFMLSKAWRPLLVSIPEEQF